MAPQTSNRMAWSIAIASLALWATNSPLSWGQVAADAGRLLEQSNTETTTNPGETVADGAPTATGFDATEQSPPCLPLPPAMTQPAPPVPVAPPNIAGQEGNFHVCGTDAQAAQAIEQLIAGRGFSARLTSRGDGCADLAIKVASSDTTSGRASSNLTVSLGAGGSLSIQIVSEGGVTHASIGPNR
jgi:hypothetical protein